MLCLSRKFKCLMLKRKVYLLIPIGWLILIGGCLYTPPEHLGRIEDKIDKIEERYEQGLASLQSERNTLRTKLNEAHQQVKSLQTELESLRKQISKLMKENEKLASKIAGATPETHRSQPRVIGCKITAINPEANILILSVGEQDGIFSGAELEACRDNQVIGRLKIDVVETDWSSAKSLRTEDLKKFQIGDELSLQIK